MKYTIELEFEKTIEMCHKHARQQAETLSILKNAINNEGLQLGVDNPDFFPNSFVRRIGRSEIRTMIEEGWSASQIEETWEEDVRSFKQKRRKYLLYDE